MAVVAPAGAETLNVDTTITNAGSCSASNDSCAENYLVTTASNATEVVSVPPAASFAFADSFNQSGDVSTGSNFGPSATYNSATSAPPWNFQDNILFTTNTALVQAQAIAQLGNVSNLQTRIISVANPNAGGSPFDLNSPSTAAALLGASGVVTIEDGWTNFVYQSLNVDYSATLANTLAAGTYILQIRGEAAPGSTYSGSITFSPVPLPPSGWLLLAGLGGLVLLRRSPRSVDAV